MVTETRRACSNCPAYLRKGNQGPLCGPCERSVRESARAILTSNVDLGAAVLELLGRRPMTVSELCGATAASDKQMRDKLYELIGQTKVERAPKAGGYRHYRLAVDAESLMAEAS